MMHEDRYTDFDLQIRSMLQDAEEEVPSRVWDAVSGRIERTKVVSLWWRRAAAGVAAAAVVALGVFFSTDRPSSVPDSPVLAEIQPSENMNRAVEETREASDVIESFAKSSLLASGGIDRPATVNRAVGNAEGNAPSGEVEQNVAPAADTRTESDCVRETPAEVAERVSEKGSEEVSGEQYRDDPFARMAYEDAHRRSGTESLSGFVQGNVTSNERSSKAPGHMASSSSGVPTSTGVKENSISTYGIPLAFGVGVKYRFAQRWSVSAALNYSLLSRSFTGTYYDVSNSGTITREVSADITNNLHYLGIPVNLYFDVLSSNRVSFYTFGGFSVEKGIMNKYRVHSHPVINYSESVSGLQWSSALGLGIEFSLNDYLNLYLDPSARYYFDCDQPKNVRTQKPFMMNVEVGLRFNI